MLPFFPDFFFDFLLFLDLIDFPDLADAARDFVLFLLDGLLINLREDSFFLVVP